MKVGVFGGSFDPVHIGHLIVADAAADKLGLDRVLLIPAHTQPFKLGSHYASPADRLAMLEAAIADNPKLAVDGREIERAGTSFTFDTLNELTAEYPDDQLFLMVGADAAQDLPDWHRVEDIPRIAAVVVLSRPGSEELPSGIPAARIEVPAIGISATMVRETLRAGGSARYLVPEAVRVYIETHGLYTV